MRTPAQISPPSRMLRLDESEGITFAIFRDTALRERALHSSWLSWPTALKSLPDLGTSLASGRNVWQEAQLVRRGNVICHVRVTNDGYAYVQLASAEQTALQPAEAELRELLPPPERSDNGSSILLRFWHYEPAGAHPSSRRIAVPRWQDVESNYSARTRAQLESLMDGYRPGVGGQLLLWHGAPGTGKTFALRSLLWQWRSWCDAHFILDPETFFGERPDYMLEVMLGADELGDDLPPPTSPTEEEWLEQVSATRSDHDGTAERWRLLILEDTGELLAADAKERAGPGLSRLLNVVDGLVGQGLRLLILVTGNEPLQRLHPALSRPGRCGSVVEFAPLDERETSEWLAARGCENGDSAGAALAELYARVEGRSRPADARRIGFA